MAFEEAGKGELSARLARSRAAMDRDLAGLAWEADVGARLKSSIRRKSGLWMAGAAVAGLALAVIPGRRKKTPRGSGGVRAQAAAEAAKTAAPVGALAGFLTAMLPVLKLIFPVIRPALMQFAGDAFTRFRQSSSQSQQQSP